MSPNVYILTAITLIISYLIVHYFSWWMGYRFLDKTDLEYDFIIVGAGSAGCVLANRLSEDPSIKVLLLEAGSHPPWWLNIPLLTPFGQLTRHNWNYSTVRQKHAFWATINQQPPWPKGKCIGGSSSLNYMIYSRGSPQNYDLWSSMGLEGWSYANVLPYFIKSESVQDDDLRKSGSHGQNGPLHVSKVHVEDDSILNAFLKGAKELGYDEVDLNSDTSEGFMQIQATIQNGQRISSSAAYLVAALQRENLHVMIDAQVTKILFDKAEAIGVEYVNLKTNQKYMVLSKMEVILSAGAVETPHILMVSGVGPKRELDKYKISLVADIPAVGNFLQDHVAFPLMFSIDKPVSINEYKLMSPVQAMKYFLFGTGYFSSSATDGIANLYSSLNKNHSQSPDLQFILMNMGSINAEIFSQLGHVNIENLQELIPDVNNSSREGFLLLTAITQPQSYGNISLLSDDPLVPPAIDPNSLEDDKDTKIIIEGIKLGWRLALTVPFQELGTKPTLPQYRRCKDLEHLSDAHLACIVKTGTISLFHASGTCRMGHSGDKTTVVDERLRVHGLTKLRVIDASIMPKIVSSPINAVVIMIAEKAADMIKKDNKLK